MPPKYDRSGIKKPCKFFTTPQGCKYGKSCKFSHGGSTNDDNNATESHRYGTPQHNGQRSGYGERSAEERDFHTWRFNIPRKAAEFAPLGRGLSKFWKTAYALLQTEDNVRQQVVISLASEGGLLRVNETVQQRFDLMPDEAKITALTEQITPLLGILSYPEVVASPVLEQQVGVLYNYLYGLNGTRLLPILRLLTDTLPVLTAGIAGPDLDVTQLVETVGIVLARLFDICGGTLVDDKLHAQLQAFVAACPELSSATAPALWSHSRKCFARIQCRVDIGAAIPSILPSQQSNALAAPTFYVAQRPPGGRHNNDHADICDISILPSFEEIRCVQDEYLPTIDPEDSHLQGVEGLLDRQFRLLREDTVGQLRNAVATELGRLQQDDGLLAAGKLQKSNSARTYVYRHVQLSDMRIEKQRDLRIVIDFELPADVKNLKHRDQIEYWERTRRLQPDALICLLSGRGAAVFCSVAVTPRTERPISADELSSDEAVKPPERAILEVKLASDDRNDANTLLDFFINDAAACTIVEFPGVLLPAFEFTLKALQQMKTTAELPFSEYLIPSPAQAEEIVPPPPTYAAKPGFRFNLACLLNSGDDLWLSPNAPVDMAKLRSESTLDEKQAVGLINALTRSLALIQGPPGTGKSYVGEMLIKVLLKNKSAQMDIGPILCVTYTNHALDQQLEHLVGQGVKQIIRMGSQSKSEVLKSLTLFEVSQKVMQTKSEKAAYGQAKETLTGCERRLKEIIDQTKGVQLETRLRAYLEEYYPHHYAQLFNVQDDGWQIAGRKNRSKIEAWYHGGGPSKEHRDLRELLHANLHSLTKQDRARLYGHWVTDIDKRAKRDFVRALEEFRDAREHLDKISRSTKLRCLQQANVIGCTTSGLARNLDLLRRLKAKVMLCEEAGEVLEAHTLTAFLPSVQHAILIGDHEQLRPQTQNYRLRAENPRGGSRYSLDVSLFERLVRPGAGTPSVRIPFTTLETQRRMHPSVSELVRTSLYPTLQDHPTVTEYPEVAGMRRRLFWLQHSNAQDGGGDSRTTTSYTNTYEIEMTTALVSHLIRQGVYDPTDIAVLTPYLGQLRKLRRRLQDSFEIAISDRDEEDLEKHGLNDETPATTVNTNAVSKVAVGVAKTTLLQALRIATVDNFQGEEAKVIVISLVRSNAEKKCGFLSTSNRINVLLSRAKHGMYIIGDADTCANVPMWANTHRILQAGGNFGIELELQCPRHPDMPIAVSKPDDFVVFSPEGGCDQRCVDRLPCGHACQQMCHAVHLHNAVYCLDACPRSLPGCDHSCPLACGDKCRPCQETITLHGEERVLGCGHTIDMLPCWQHQRLDLYICKERVSQSIPGCGHTVEVRCGTDVTSTHFFCDAQCGAPLACGHSCKRPCHQCRPREGDNAGKVDHGECRQTCGRAFTTCNHACDARCHAGKPCPLCSRPCDVKCSHSKCRKKCSEPCTPCAEEKCSSCCPHAECTMPCAAPCNWLPCSKRCEKKLGCDHQCPTLCGEQCPDRKFCQICATDEIKSLLVDYIEGKTYVEIDLDEEPCMFPSCGHVITVFSLDGQMGFSKYYNTDADGVCTAITSVDAPFSTDEVKCCPQCRGSLRNIARYGMIVRRAYLDIATKRFISSTTQDYVSYAQEFQALQDQLSASVDDFDAGFHGLREDCVLTGSRGSCISGLPDNVRMARYKSLSQLRKKIVTFAKNAEAEEQPFGRVWQAAQNARRRHGAQLTTITYDANVIQTKAHLLATSLGLQCDLTILADFLNLRRNAPPTPVPAKLLVNFTVAMRDCESLINDAKKASARLQEAQGHIYFAHFAALERVHAEPERGDALKENGATHLEAARAICAAYPASTAVLLGEVDSVDRLLKNGVFYCPVTSDEMREVWAAMSREFSGTGHWYTCENGHYFTIGECGMAMETARCPECDAPIGGQNHQAVAGVAHAHALERQMADMRI